MLSRKSLAVVVSTAAVTFASAAAAQAPAAPRPAAAAPATQIRHGAAIAGVCTYSNDRAIGTSELGKYVIARVKQLGAEATAELQAEETAVKNEARSVDAARATMTPDAFEKRASDLQIRANALQRKADQRQRELQLTERKALMRVVQELDPIVLGLYQQRQCSVLLGDVLVANPQMDLTDQAVTGLNAKLKTIAINRERLDAPAAPAPAAAVPPKR